MNKTIKNLIDPKRKLVQEGALKVMRESHFVEGNMDESPRGFQLFESSFLK
jgi:hypothetical protein